MSDLKPEIHLMTPVPMRTAEEQWQSASYQCGVYATLDHEGLVFVDGKGGQACMRQEEWMVYQARCLQGAPTVSMLEATAGEDDPLAGGEAVPGAAELQRIYQSLSHELRQICDLVRVAKTTLSIEDYGDALSGAHDRLSMCVGCVDGLLQVPCAADCPMPRTCKVIGCVEAQCEGGAA